MLTAGFIMLLGVIVDLGILWLLQRQLSPQWEFTAITNTVESVPRLVFAVGFLFLNFHLRGTYGIGWYRALAVLRSVAIKTIGLSTVYAMVAVPVEPCHAAAASLIPVLQRGVTAPEQ